MTKIMRAKSSMPMAVNSKTISLSLAAEKVGVSADKLIALINRGEGPPFIQLGRDKVFRERTIEAWLERRERDSLKILKNNRVITHADGEISKSKRTSNSKF